MTDERAILRDDAGGAAYDPARSSALHDAWWAQHGADLWAARRPPRVTRDPNRRLRVGYVGGDFCFHSAAMAFSPMIFSASTDVETFAYATTPRSVQDETTMHFKQRLGWRFVDVSAFPPAALATIIRTDKIDILVDLSGLTPHHRFATFAAQPAPIQLTGWGYVTDHGWPCFTGILADPFVAPPETRSAMRSRVIDLPCVLTNLLRPGLTRRTRPDGPPVFGVFQRAGKFTAETCRVWSRLLSGLPTATLLIRALQATPDFESHVRAKFDAGVRARVRFEALMNHGDHMERHNAVDVMLDTWPQAGGCSTLEALWMGVPVVTLVGDRLMQRTSGSCLHLVGLPECVARDEEDYILTARALVSDRARLTALRATLPTTLMHSPIIRGYVRAVETAYKQLWRSYCAQAKDQAA